LYTSIMTMALAPFRCFKQVDGSFTLVPASNFNCYDDEWNKRLFPTMIGLMYVPLIPLFFIWILWKHKNNLKNNSFVFRYGYLIARLKPGLYWWNVFQLLRKALLVMLIDLTNNLDPFLRIFAVVLVLFALLFLETSLRPYNNDMISQVSSLV
jgi:hypothetical protein